ncbi:MAG: CoA pyrophosphatase [Lachnospiraceae bacterium]|nr:CoA pyrophosphatase [Lachnospiraceae bacterium]
MYAVLLPFVNTDKGDCLLLEVRSDLVSQPGEVCFPGGKMEEGETPEQAALREACEELHLPSSEICVINELLPEKMKDGRLVFPVSARISGEALSGIVLSGKEVASVFLLPLSWLKAHPGGDGRNSLYWEYEGHVIWGLTARIIRQIL